MKDDVTWLRDLPAGWMSGPDLKGVLYIASLRPQATKVVEIGSLLGRSAKAWAVGLPNAEIICIDPWIDFKLDEYGQRSMRGYFEGCDDNTYERFLQFAAAHPNVTPMRRKSPVPIDEWPHGKVDIVFIDGSHTEPAVSSDIEFARQITRPGSIICGHDFYTFKIDPEVERQFGSIFGRDVIDAVHSAAGKNGEFRTVYEGAAPVWFFKPIHLYPHSQVWWFEV